MKKLVALTLFLVAFAFGADVKPFVFGNVANDSALQQQEFEYMLQYKLYGTEYIQMGRRVVIPDKSGWNGSAGYISSYEGIELGGPVLTTGNISLGDGCRLTTGPIRANSLTAGNDNNVSLFAGNICLNNTSVSNSVQTGINRAGGKFSCDDVPEAPAGLAIPTIDWDNIQPDTVYPDIEILDNYAVATINVPDGESTYDILIDKIHLCKSNKYGGDSREGCTLNVVMQDGGRLTRIFVRDMAIGNHTTFNVIYRTDEGNYTLSQKEYRGNLMFYSNEDFRFVNTDYSIIKGTFITTSQVYLKSNIDFAGQFLGTQLVLGDDFKGENFRFVKFDPDTLDFNPELNKNGGLKENDSTVIIPIQLSDTATIDVFFNYCFDLKDGVTVDDFNQPPTLPLCSTGSITTKIPRGDKIPVDTIKVNVKIDTLTELNEYLIMKISIESGAVLPNGKTDGELKIKIIDAENSYVTFDTTAVYSFEENKTGVVDLIKVLNKTDSTKFYLDSAFTGRYTLDEKTGELKLIANPLDYETSSTDYIKVTLKDTNNVVVTRTIPISVIDVNEAPSLNDTTITLSENIPIPSIVGTLKASDPDIATAFRQNVYELISGSEYFNVDNSGRITATKIFNYETDDTVYTLKVVVKDKNTPTLCDTATVTIKIGNINEGPQFPTTDTTFFVNENTPAGKIGSIPAYDDDGDKITYTIVGTVPFTIDELGNVSSTRPFDYETETGFSFKVVASDGTLTDTVKVNVKINNVNEECSVSDTTFSIDENTTGKVGTVNAADKDKDALYGTITYTISDSVNYQIDKDGNVFVKNALNFEDIQFDTLKVYITDGTFKDTGTVVIKVNDVPEDIVVTATITPVEENVEIGTPVGVVKGIDGDSTDVTYTINTTEFKIDPVTGVITTNTNIDYETKNEYTVTVTATSTDGSKKDTVLTIPVINVNEPVHVQDTTFDVEENYIGPIGKIEGEDDDREPLQYIIRNSDDYTIDSLGSITIINPLDYETKKTDTLIVDVTTPSGDKDSAIVIINVKNVNENPILQPNDSLTVPENCKNCIIGVIVAVDPDSDPIIYTVIEPGFTIDSTGTLKTKDPIDYETTKEIPVTIIAKDTNGAADTMTYIVKVTDVNEPVHVNDTTCTVKENYTGAVCKIIATDEDKTIPIYTLVDTTDYTIDSTGVLIIKNPIDYEKKTKDTVTVIVTDGTFYDTAQVIINVQDEIEKVEITTFDDEPKKDTIKTNNPEHTFDWQVCEDKNCIIHKEFPIIHKDTVIKVCNDKKTVCDSVVVLFNDAPPIVTLTNATSTTANIDYITIEEQKEQDRIYVNKKDNNLTVIVKDTVHNETKTFEITVKLDTVHVSKDNVQEYKYIIDETKAEIVSIGGGLAEMKETIKDGNTYVTISKIINLETKEPIDTVQTVTYKKKQGDKEITISYKTDNMTGERLTNYQVSYNTDSSTTVTFELGDDKKIVKNEEGNIGYTVTYEYTDDYGNKASSKVDILFDDIPPKVEIITPYDLQSFNTNAIEVKWLVNGEVQDTLTLQRLEPGVNYIIRRYVDKAGNECADTVKVLMKEAKDITVSIIHPVNEIDKDKVDQWYSEGNKYNKKNPYTIKITDPKTNELPETIGIGFKVDIALPSVSPTGGLATLDDIVKNGMIPIDDKGNIVGASTKGIPVKEYVEEHCTIDFQDDFKKNGLNIPLYDVTYKLHLWVWTTTASYVNDFTIEYELNDQALASEAGTVQMVIDWLADKNGAVNASNGHQLGTSSYITRLYSKSIAKHRCDYKGQKMGEQTVKKDEDTTIFGYKRATKK